MASPQSLPTRIKVRSAAKKLTSTETGVSVAALALAVARVAIMKLTR
jgi:hypothetical protein